MLKFSQFPQSGKFMEQFKGSRDLLSEEMIRFRHIEQTFMSCCLGWGYREIRTPTLEYLHLFTSTGTLPPGMLSRVYSFLDWDGWSGERVALRPDSTIPAARLYIDNLSKSRLSRLFYVENIFSYEETGRESRERWQCGAELIGSNKPSSDVELILLALETLEKLGIKGVKLHLSHAGLIRALLEELKLAPGEQSWILNQILNGDKEAVKKLINSNPQLSDSLSILLKLKGKSPGFLENLKTSLRTTSPHIEESIWNFIAVTQLLSTAGCEYQIDMASGKGFEYYTGIIFHFYLNKQNIGGGGRYNNLIPLLGGGNTPASGFALYIDPLMNLPLSGNQGETRQRILLRSVDDLSLKGKLYFESAGLLRRAGYIVELDQGHVEEKDYHWVINIGRKDEPSLVLNHTQSGKSIGADSPSEILNILQETETNEAGSS